MAKRVTLDNYITITKDEVQYAMFRKDGVENIESHLHVLEIGFKNGEKVWLGFSMMGGVTNALRKLR